MASTLPFPHLASNNYNEWSVHMETFFRGQQLWDPMGMGFDVMFVAAVTVTLKAQRETRVRDKKALCFLHQGVDDANFDKITKAKTSNTAWELLRKAYQSVDERRKEKEEEKEVAKAVEQERIRKEEEDKKAAELALQQKKIKKKEKKILRKERTRLRALTALLVSNVSYGSMPSDDTDTGIKTESREDVQCGEAIHYVDETNSSIVETEEAIMTKEDMVMADDTSRQEEGEIVSKHEVHQQHGSNTSDNEGISDSKMPEASSKSLPEVNEEELISEQMPEVYTEVLFTSVSAEDMEFEWTLKNDDVASEKDTVNEMRLRSILNFEGDPWGLLEEIRQELNFEKDLNANLQLQLQKTQESNSELLLAVQEMKQFNGEAESEIASLKEKLAFVKMSFGRQKGNLDESERRSKRMNEEATRTAELVEALKSELEVVKGENALSLENEKLAASSIQTLLEEENQLMDELETCREEEEMSKKAMESLASALHEVSTEAREAKEKLLYSQVEQESLDAHIDDLKQNKVEYEKQIEDLGSALKTTNEKYAAMLDDAKQEINNFLGRNAAHCGGACTAQGRLGRKRATTDESFESN